MVDAPVLERVSRRGVQAKAFSKKLSSRTGGISIPKGKLAGYIGATPIPCSIYRIRQGQIERRKASECCNKLCTDSLIVERLLSSLILRLNVVFS